MAMHPLGRLITERMQHPGNNWSLDDVVRRAEAQGEKLGRSNLDKLRKEAPRSLSQATIFALAAGLGVTPLTVANAALESMGIETRPVEVTDSIATIEIDPNLSEANKRALIALIREMRHEPPLLGRRNAWPPPRYEVPRAGTKEPERELPTAARTTPRGYRKGRTEQDASVGEESQVDPMGDE